MMTFEVLIINILHLSPVFKKIAEQYQFQITQTFFSDYDFNDKLFHVVLIDQEQNNYQELLQKISINNSYTYCIMFVYDKEKAYKMIHHPNILFFLVDSNESEILYHQFWTWLLTLVLCRFGINNHKINIAGGELFLDESIFTKNGTTHSLSFKQCEIMKMLVQNRGKVVSRINLLDNIWNTNKIVTDRVIDTNIAGLRKILGDDARRPQYLETIFGQGYRLN